MNVATNTLQNGTRLVVTNRWTLCLSRLLPVSIIACTVMSATIFLLRVPDLLVLHSRNSRTSSCTSFRALIIKSLGNPIVGCCILRDAGGLGRGARVGRATSQPGATAAPSRVRKAWLSWPGWSMLEGQVLAVRSGYIYVVADADEAFLAQLLL